MRYLLDSDTLSDLYEPSISADSIYGDLQKTDPMLRTENWLV